jgi:hypothetical protein
MKPVARLSSRPGRASHMDYVSRSKPAFVGDIQHDLRDHMLDRRLDTLSVWVGTASERYLRAARLLGHQNRDAIAISLAQDDHFDARTLWVAHDHMAAHWRSHLMPPLRADPRTAARYSQEDTWSYFGLTQHFRGWLLHETAAWADRQPDVLHLLLLTVLGDHTRSGQSVEIELCLTLADLYPLPGLSVPKPLPNGPFP